VTLPVLAERQYCNFCYSDAEKAGRKVYLRDRPGPYDNKTCDTCESRLREGLVHYRPSNGTEWQIFEERCENCRHRRQEGYEDATKPACTWGISDKLLNAMWQGYEGEANWHDPANLKTVDEDGDSMCPAECLRFSPHGDDGNEPPEPHDPHQLTFDDIDVPHEPPAVVRFPSPRQVSQTLRRAREAEIRATAPIQPRRNNP
jgi:hypothetical protein